MSSRAQPGSVQTTEFGCQVGGHVGVFFRCVERNTLLKRADHQEERFYKNVTRWHHELVPFIPRFHGTIQLLNTPSNLTPVPYIEIDDLTAGFRRPCVMDIKLGTRTYGPFAPAEKVASQRAKAVATTAATLGLRLIGVKLFDRVSQEYRFLGGNKGRSIGSRAALVSIIRPFFEAHSGGPLRKDLLRSAQIFLADLISCLGRQSVYRFYAASLLFVYDGDPPAAPPPGTAPLRVRLIDFAHAHRFQDTPETILPDDGCLLGVSSALAILEELYDESLGSPLLRN